MNIGQLVINSLVFSAVGIAVLFVAYFIVEKITPEKQKKYKDVDDFGDFLRAKVYNQY